MDCLTSGCGAWLWVLRSHHIEDERVDVKVGLLLHVVDDAALDHDAATLHLQTRRLHARHLVTLQVAKAPGQNLKGGFKRSFFLWSTGSVRKF